MYRGIAIGLFLGVALGYSVGAKGPVLPEEVATYRAPGAQMLYQSLKYGESYANEIHHRKLCGDDQHPCSAWKKVATLKTDRPFPPSDIELNEAGGRILMDFPSGEALKSDDQSEWRLEPPPR